jgi:hypothetical protein
MAAVCYLRPVLLMNLLMPCLAAASPYVLCCLWTQHRELDIADVQRVGQNHTSAPHMTYDTTFRDFPAKTTLHTPLIRMGQANPTDA